MFFKKKIKPKKVRFCYKHKSGRKNYSFTNAKVWEIESANRILLKKILSRGPLEPISKKIIKQIYRRKPSL